VNHPVPCGLLHPNVSIIGRPMLPPDARYALLLRLDGAYSPRLPRVAPSLSAFARMLHRARAGAGLQLQDTALRVANRATPAAGVSIWLTDPSTGDRSRYLGWAYLAGGGRQTLQDALYAEARQ